MANQAKAHTETRQVPPLARRAAIRTESLNDETRTVEVVWTTGARVRRGGVFTEPFIEELSLEPGHVRMGRLNNGAPLLNAHRGFDNKDVIGVVESARLDGDEGVATVRFASADVDQGADEIYRKVKDQIIRNVSVGYEVHVFEFVDEDEATGLPVFRAVDWEPFELSPVPLGADAGAQFRAEGAQTNPCEFVLAKRGADMAVKKNKGSQGGSTPARAVAAEPEPTVETPDAKERTESVDDIAERAKNAERKRAGEIRRLVEACDIDPTLAKRWIDEDMTVEQARAAAIDIRADKRQEEAPVENIRGNVRAGGGEDLTRLGAQRGLPNALLHRADPGLYELDDAGRMYRGMTMLEQARAFLEAHGVKTHGLSKKELAGLALGVSQRGGYHSTSDYPLLLADVAGKTLRRAYEEAPQTFQVWARRTTLPDFKDVKRTQFGEAPQLLRVLEGGEFTRGTIGEGREVYSLLTYGRIFPVTRQTLINDDLDALTRVPAMYGRSARDLESDLVYSHFTSNPLMGDGIALFNASHGNVGTGVISIANIGSGRGAMRKQTGLDGKQRINVQAKTLLVPAALETVADQFVSTNMRADTAGNINPFAGRLQSVAEPRLDDASAIEWYLAGDPAAVDTLEYATLEGESGPRIESRIGFDVDGLEIKASHDFGTKAIDHRGFYRSSGS